VAGEPVVLTAGPAEARVDPAAGGRIGALRVAGHELLVTDAAEPVGWGCFPMAPFAGRVRRGALRTGDAEATLPPRLGPHAAHGTVLDRRWRVVDARDREVTLRTALGPDWPWAGHVVHRVALHPDRLELDLEVHATDAAFPASCGWHPWFRRHLAPGGPTLRLDVRPGARWRRDAEGLPTGERVAPGPHPWDDCVDDLAAPPRLRWPGALEVELRSPCEHWVVFTHPTHAVCVEPHTAPPDPFRFGAHRVVPGRPLRAELTVAWRLDGPDATPTPAT
jgi:aldose 1-epimerase